MKYLPLILLLLLASSVITVGAQQQQPEPGIYRGYITVTRKNVALRLNDVTTLVIVGEIYENGPDRYQFAWTARNFDQSSRLDNLWADILLDYAAFQSAVPDMGLWPSHRGIPGGNTIPGSFKMTTKSLAWKCSKEGNAPYARNITVTTTFSIVRTGQSPVPDQQN